MRSSITSLTTILIIHTTLITIKCYNRHIKYWHSKHSIKKQNLKCRNFMHNRVKLRFFHYPISPWIDYRLNWHNKCNNMHKYQCTCHYHQMQQYTISSLQNRLNIQIWDNSAKIVEHEWIVEECEAWMDGKPKNL